MVYASIGSSGVSWAGKTYPEIAALAAEPGSVLVMPTGSLEQHGRHLPTATDTILADAVATVGAERVADELPVLVTPPVWSGFSPHHLPFGGTVTLEVETMLHLLEDVADAALDNGFDALLFVNGHGGNTSIVGAAVSSIGTTHPHAQVLAINYARLAAPFIDEIRESDIGGMSHGGEFETSLMLHLRPDLVHMDRVEIQYREEPYTLGKKDAFKTGPLSVYREFTEYTEHGPIGDPSLGSEEKGAELYDRLGDELAGLLREIHEQNVG